MKKAFQSYWPILLWIMTTTLLIIAAFKLAKHGEELFTYVLAGGAVIFFFGPILGMFYDKELKNWVEEDLKSK